MTYSKRLEKETKTRFFVNNPTPEEARKALGIGNVIGAVTNGNYIKKMLTSPETKQEMTAYVDGLIRQGLTDEEKIAAHLARHAVGRIAKIFEERFEKTRGAEGWTAIQGDPNYDTDYDYMISEADFFYQEAPNIRVKFPATDEAMQALETMTARGKATLATCGFSIRYGIDAFEAYKRGCQKGKGAPVFYVTMLAGHVDEYLEKYIKANQISLSDEALHSAGCEFAKILYQVQQDRYSDLNAKVLGGCRTSAHFTEMVPGDMCVTVNYDFIEMLNEMNPEVEERCSRHADEKTIKELTDKLPFYNYTISENSTEYIHWSLLPTALYFRNYVRTGWNDAVSIIRERKVMFR